MIVIKADVPKGVLRVLSDKMTTFAYDEAYDTVYIDDLHNHWSTKGSCLCCNDLIYRKLNKTMADLAREQEKNMLWQQPSNKICGRCSNELMDLAQIMNKWFSDGYNSDRIRYANFKRKRKLKYG